MCISSLKAGDLYKADLVLGAVHHGDWSWLRLLKSNEGRLAEEFLMVDSDDNQYDPRAAQNKNTPKDLLIKLAEIPQDVWDKILDKIPEAWDSGIGRIRSKIAHNPNTPKETLRKLSEDKNSSVRAKVAFNPNTPKDILIKLSEEKSHLVIASLARNENTPNEVLLKIKRTWTNRGRASEYAANALEFRKKRAK